MVLNRSLQESKSVYSLLCMVSDKVSEKIINMLKENDITIHRITSVVIPDKLRDTNIINGYAHWNQTFEKLSMFDLCDHEKIVFLDADMIVMNNIDELFDRPHMSAVAAGKFKRGWDDLNSGLIVIHPEANTSRGILNKLMDIADFQVPLGDQDLIKMYYGDWKSDKNLHLPETYNCLYGYLDFYINARHIEWNKVNVIHFIGKVKPWTMRGTERFRHQLLNLLKGKIYAFYAFSKYCRCLKRAMKSNI